MKLKAYFRFPIRRTQRFKNWLGGGAMNDELETLDDLLSALASPDPRSRGRAAHRVLDFAEAAVDALFQAIARPENRDHLGTLVYVLCAFNCESRFTELFDLALHGHYEVQNHALSILRGQSLWALRVTKRMDQSSC